jgi:DNA-binding HxlR family transcriptional regulator
MFLILLELFDAHKDLRFSDLREAVPGITAKVLSNRLKELEDEGIVYRSVLEQSIPPKTQYGLTPCGAECVEIIRVTKKWTLNWKEHPPLCPVYQERRCPL